MTDNHIGEDGVRDLMKGVGFQTSVAAMLGKNPGLMRLCINVSCTFCIINCLALVWLASAYDSMSKVAHI